MKFHLERSLAFAAALLCALLALAVTSGCTSYPDCDDDEICQEEGRREYCVNGKCNQCRDDSHCAGACGMCESGKCGRIPGCCASNADCPSDLPKCVDNRCNVECTTDKDCTSGFRCDANKCVKEDECNDQKPCPAGFTCKDLKCIKDTYCPMKLIHFDLDESKIRADAKQPLQDNADCYNDRTGKQGDISLKVVGHCDERNTEEYNMVLGEKRAKAAVKALKGLGVPEKKMTAQSRGELEPLVRNASSESDHQKNRRVEFQVQ
jgi:peptidoglycan-associated lipoprotein